MFWKLNIHQLIFLYTCLSVKPFRLPNKSFLFSGSIRSLWTRLLNGPTITTDLWTYQPAASSTYTALWIPGMRSALPRPAMMPLQLFISMVICKFAHECQSEARRALFLDICLTNSAQRRMYSQHNGKNVARHRYSILNKL